MLILAPVSSPCLISEEQSLKFGHKFIKVSTVCLITAHHYV